MFLKKLLSSFHCFYFLYLFICNYLSLSILMWVTWKARTFQFVFIPYPCENPGWKSVTAKDASLPVVTVVLFSRLTHSPCLSWGIIAERIHLSCCHSWLIPLLVGPLAKTSGWLIMCPWSSTSFSKLRSRFVVPDEKGFPEILYVIFQ